MSNEGDRLAEELWGSLVSGEWVSELQAKAKKLGLTLGRTRRHEGKRKPWEHRKTKTRYRYEKLEIPVRYKGRNTDVIICLDRFLEGPEKGATHRSMMSRQINANFAKMFRL